MYLVICSVMCGFNCCLLANTDSLVFIAKIPALSILWAIVFNIIAILLAQWRIKTIAFARIFKDLKRVVSSLLLMYRKFKKFSKNSLFPVEFPSILFLIFKDFSSFSLYDIVYSCELKSSQNFYKLRKHFFKSLDILKKNIKYLE